MQRRQQIVKQQQTSKAEIKKGDKQIIGLDLGNSTIRVIYSTKQIDIRTTLLIENNNVYINKRPTPLCLMDLVVLMSKKYDDPSFQSIVKYYNYPFKKGINQNIIVSTNPISSQSLYFQLTLALTIKALFLTNPTLKYLSLSQKPIHLITTVFEGKLNPYRNALQTCLQIAGITSFSFVNSSVCLAANHLKINKKTRDDTEVIGIIDFGSQGMTFSIYKLYHMQPGIIEALYSQTTYFGGLTFTHLLVDYVTAQLIKDKGMDITKNSLLMHRLKLLCEEAKHILSNSDHAFIRLDGLPDIVVYGCQVSLLQFQKCIQQPMRENFEVIKKILKMEEFKISKLMLNGGSCKIPLFKRLLAKEIQKQQIIQSDHDELKRGLLHVKSQGVRLIDICSFNLRLEGDEKLAINLVKKGETLPIRKKQTLKFPSGQLTYSLKFYQNDQLIATCFIPERPRQNTFSLYVEINHNKILQIYASTSQGLIKMNCNMMQIPKQEFIKYEQILNKVDFHIQTD